MKILHAIILLLLGFPVWGQINVGKNHEAAKDCNGVVHGVVLGQDGKPWGGVELILEPVGDYDYMLPHTKTDQQGEYRFGNVCSGRWGVFVEDKEAGYPRSGRYMNWFLYGNWSPEIEITDKNLDAEMTVNVPPKPGQLRVRLTNSKSKARIGSGKIELKVTRKRNIRLSWDDSDSNSPCLDPILVPPDQDVVLHVTSKGFHQWRGTGGHKKAIHVSAGEVLTVDVELDPI